MVTICTASLTFNNSTFCPHTVFMCFVWISEQTAIISLYNINWLVSITETKCVYYAVRTDSPMQPTNLHVQADVTTRNKTSNILYVQRNTESRSRHHCRNRKAINITYCECVFVALVMQHEMRMRHIVPVTCPTLQYFLSNTTCVLIFSSTFVQTFLILRRTERDIIKNIYRSSSYDESFIFVWL